MLPFNGAPPARGLPQAPGAPSLPHMPGFPPMGFPPRGMLPPRPMAVPPGGNMLLRGPPMVLGPRGASFQPVGAPMETVVRPTTLDAATVEDPGPFHVFVGKLPPDLHDNIIRRLLETCGAVATWKRASDPITNKPIGFGYCTFARTLDMTRALRLLDGFAIGSHKILLKVDSKNLATLDELERSLPDHVRASEQSVDEGVKQTLKAIFQGQSGADETPSPTANGPTEGGTVVGGNAVKSQEETEAETDGSGSPSAAELTREKIMGEVEKFRMAQKDRDQELERKRLEAVRERLRLEREKAEKRKADEELKEKRQQEALAAEKKLAEEKQAREERRRQQELDAAATAEQQQTVKDNSEQHREVPSLREPDSRDGGSRHRGRSRSQSRSRSRAHKKHSRRSGSSRHRHRRGSHDDDRSASRSQSRSRSHRRSDHRRSKRRSHSHSEDRSERRRHRAPRDMDAPDALDDFQRRESVRKRRRTSPASNEKVLETKRSRSPHATHSSESSRHSTLEQSLDRDPSETKTPKKLSIKELPKVVLGLKLQSNTSKKDKAASAVSVPLAFGVQEVVEVKPKREIVPIDYTKEERVPSSTDQRPSTQTVTTDKLKALIDQIPTDKDALFAFPIDWAVVDSQRLIDAKMRAWVGKKILEYLGEEEPTMAEFVLAKLREHVRPHVILDEMRLVLEDEADVFVALLWRKLAFEAARAIQS